MPMLAVFLLYQQRFPDPVAKFYAAEVALALNYLHSLDIIYRDLKPENILLNYDGHIKIADFGFAKYCNTNAWTLCGTPDYLAPEVSTSFLLFFHHYISSSSLLGSRTGVPLTASQIIRNERYNKSVDWYALGVLIFEMLSGLPPFHEPNGGHVVLYEKITLGPKCIRWPGQFHPNATDLILKFMEHDPTKRYGNLRHGAGDVFAHPWFREVDWEKLRNREITAPYLPKINGAGDASACVSSSSEYMDLTDFCWFCIGRPVSKHIQRTTSLPSTEGKQTTRMGLCSPTSTIAACSSSTDWNRNWVCTFLTWVCMDGVLNTVVVHNRIHVLIGLYA